MKTTDLPHLLIIGVIAVFFFNGCQPSDHQERPFSVRIGMTAEPDVLNPITYKTVNARVINALLFQKLLDVDFQTLELVPVLCTSRPSITSHGDSLYTISYRIREEARWDNGVPVTAYDVDFSMKVGLLPGIENEGKREYLECIRRVVIDSTDTRMVSFICTPSMRMEYATGAELGILPAHHYDPDSVIRSIAWSDVIRGTLDSAKRSEVENWAKGFNTPALQRMPDGVNGSGPYKLNKWEANQRIELIRKDNHWTRKVDAPNAYFESFPEEITYHFMNEPSALVAAARNNQLDVGPILRSSDYIKLKDDSQFTAQFRVLLAPDLSINTIILNACKPELKTVQTRKALAHLFDAEASIEKIQRSTGQRITGPLHPSKPTYHHEIKPYTYNITKARDLLAADGWHDDDEDGILEKRINGEVVPLKLEYKYNTGNEGRKNTGLLFKEWARPAGVEIEIVNQEWMVFIESLMKKDFELAIFSWTDEHAPTDPTTLFHSEAIDNGYNFGCFSNAVADSLMEVMAVTMDASERRAQWYTLQQILHDEVANIFLSTNDARFFMSRSMKAMTPSAQAPGYWAGSLQSEDRK